MANKNPENLSPEDGAHLPSSVIGRLAGAGVPLLPGESLDEYRRGLAETISELDASTHLQVYLAEKIFDCLWWLKRLETQKTAIVINKMVERLDRYSGDINVRGILEHQDWENKHLKPVLAAADISVRGLVAHAFKLEREVLLDIDQQLADRIKALKGLQSSYEALVNRQVMIERLHLQNAVLKRDLWALEMPLIDSQHEDVEDQADESTKSTRKKRD